MLAVTDSCILFRLLIQLLPVLLDDPVLLVMSGNKAHIVYLSPSALRTSKTWLIGTHNDIPECRCPHG